MPDGDFGRTKRPTAARRRQSAVLGRTVAHLAQASNDHPGSFDVSVIQDVSSHLAPDHCAATSLYHQVPDKLSSKIQSTTSGHGQITNYLTDDAEILVEKTTRYVAVDLTHAASLCLTAPFERHPAGLRFVADRVAGKPDACVLRMRVVVISV